MKKALLDTANMERLLGLVMGKDGWLNPQVVRGICERFIRPTHMRDLFYHWMLVAVQMIIQDLVADIQRTAPDYHVNANTV